MGWFLDVTPEILGYVLNEDGSRTYDVRVTFANLFTDEDNYRYGGYIDGAQGVINILAQIVAPAGGAIHNFSSSGGISFGDPEEYNGHLIQYCSFYLSRQGSNTLTYQVTTAPGVDADLGLSMTPTLTEYRNAD